MYSPPRRPSDPTFWHDATADVDHILYCPRSGYVNDPQLATHNLQRAAEVAGAEFAFKTEVVAVRSTKDRVQGVTLADGSEIDASIVVNVAGPHSFVINEMAGVSDSMRIKTRALRHEVHHTHEPEEMEARSADTYLVGDDDLGTYFRSDVGGQILLGSQDPDCDPQEWIVDPDEYDRGVTAEQWETQMLRLGRRIPTLGLPDSKKGVVDLYDVSDDWIPIYDRTDLGGFYVAIGTSGNQFKNASVAAYCMVELIKAVEDGHDHDRDPLRVAQRFTGLEIDLSAFSRNREINEASSFSVLG